MAKKRVPLDGSVRAVFKSLPKVGAADLTDELTVQVLLRRGPDNPKLPSLEELAAQKLGERQYLGRQQLTDALDGDPKDVERVKAFAKKHHLEVEAVEDENRLVTLSGRISHLEWAFGVKLARFSHKGVAILGHTEPITVPEELAGVVVAVHGLDGFPIAERMTLMSQAAKEAEGSGLPIPSYTPPEVAALYDFPQLDGSGETVAIVAVNPGGYDLGVLESYFKWLGTPMPKISHRGPNDYGGANTTEVMLDIETVGSIAPGAEIVVYFADSFTEALLEALTDVEHDPSVITISYGGAEVTNTKLELDTFQELATYAAARGITICVAAGNSGSNISFQTVHGGQAQDLAVTFFPASSPGVTACGGTFLIGANGQIVSETVWNFLAALLLLQPPANDQVLPINGGAGGGGVSLVFPTPSFQDHELIATTTLRNLGVILPQYVQESLGSPVPVPPVGRGVPDVAGNAIGYKFLIDGTAPDDIQEIVGTSIVTQLWGALVALLNQGLGRRLGYLSPVLYQQIQPTSGALRQITQGSNGAYVALPGLAWNPCSGLGVPDGQKLLEQLQEIAQS